MLKKLKKIMVVAAAAVMLSAGFATVAPKEASAHWADTQMNWAMKYKIITSDSRDSYATRQDTWLMLSRYLVKNNYSYAGARNYLMSGGLTDGTRGTDRVTRNEVVAMLYQRCNWGPAWDSELGFERSRAWGARYSIFDGKRGNDFATRAEVVSMLYNALQNRKPSSTWIPLPGSRLL
ncbi:protein phosphatase 2C [Bacillus toyonensis]|uniref:protein phosphatase 2C n=1 Tax=Bacillus toyonensis TaxID=155322 RepID=UPI0018D0D6C2|nr:protein phosphatase 2C [Bacillus toyonensis]MBH0358210.1 protein phosphatase 2C [Bacillus toyonensis biovar Thuringiensis]HDR3908580.1 protein phosphatase 2C [Bacillus toyonensis]HDR7409188.1 protein phosphatase 2C [Bacillus toyonensis]